MLLRQVSQKIDVHCTLALLRGTFTDESVLHFIEFVNVKESIELYKYSYHYQNRNGTLIFRYDMAPHHQEIETFPHHKHTRSGKIIEASIPALAHVLDEVDKLIAQLE